MFGILLLPAGVILVLFRVLPGRLALLGQWVLPARVVLPVLPVLRDHRVHRGFPDPRELQELQEPLVLLVLPVLPDLKVSRG